MLGVGTKNKKKGKTVAFADHDPEAEKRVFFNIHCQAMLEDAEVCVKINDTDKYRSKVVRKGRKVVLQVNSTLDALSLNNSLTIINRTEKEDEESVLYIYKVEMEIDAVTEQ
mmetsp:Transcript_11932/g.15238  ORF Transcript_11932/g.15238 Transcript_11932/m.15238 type:complete len:112 (-) Transcript_11932:153-488(-)